MNLQPVLAVFGSRGRNEFANDGFDDFGSGPIMTNNSTFWPFGPRSPAGRLIPTSPDPHTPAPTIPTISLRRGITSMSPRPPCRAESRCAQLHHQSAPGRPPRRPHERGTRLGRRRQLLYQRILQPLHLLPHARTARHRFRSGAADQAPPQLRQRGWLGRIVPNMATNFIPWGLPAGTNSVLANGQHYISGGPVQFFTNAAVRLLANAGYTVGIGPTNLVYTNTSPAPPAPHPDLAHQLLYPERPSPAPARRQHPRRHNNQFSCQSPAPVGVPPDILSSTREPVGTTVEHNIYIIGYQEATDASMAGLLVGTGTTPVMRDLNSPRDRAALGAKPQ